MSDAPIGVATVDRKEKTLLIQQEC